MAGSGVAVHPATGQEESWSTKQIDGKWIRMFSDGTPVPDQRKTGDNATTTTTTPATRTSAGKTAPSGAGNLPAMKKRLANMRKAESLITDDDDSATVYRNLANVAIDNKMRTDFMVRSISGYLGFPPETLLATVNTAAKQARNGRFPFGALLNEWVSGEANELEESIANEEAKLEAAKQAVTASAEPEADDESKALADAAGLGTSEESAESTEAEEAEAAEEAEEEEAEEAEEAEAVEAAAPAPARSRGRRS